MIVLPTSDCNGCALCANVCPKHCIRMNLDDKGFLKPIINQKLCVQCGLCEKKCPINVSHIENQGYTCYAFRSTDSRIIAQSSSGGAFSVLAEKIIEKNGVVYGASLEGINRVVHIRATEHEEIRKLRGSKYIQSEIGQIYHSVRIDLEKNVPVLFSGVPCQIVALKSFLGRRYDNLLCVGVICHGIPSKVAYDSYISYLEAKFKDKITSVNFRDKRKGWNNYHLTFKFKNRHPYSCLNRDDPFMRGFVNNIYINEACGSCKFKIQSSLADITIGDFWGVSNVISPPFDKSNQGVSAVIVTTHNGSDFWNEIINGDKKTFSYQVSTIEDCSRFNPSLVRAADINPRSSFFYENLGKIEFPNLIDACIGKTIKPTRLQKIRSLFYKFYVRIYSLK